jgi:hypothetical protein
LEQRELLSTFTVTNTLNDGSTGSLRWAINQVNSDTGPFPDPIDFNIPGTGPFTSQPTFQLRTIYKPVVIDGYSQPGASPNTQTQGEGPADASQAPRQADESRSSVSMERSRQTSRLARVSPVSPSAMA